MKNSKKIKLYIHYKITEKPWGGGNSFLKAFRNCILNNKQSEVEIVDNIKGDYNIFFVNGGHKDQGVYIDLEEVKLAKKSGFLKSLFRKKTKKILYRLDGARFKYSRKKSVMDNLQYEASRIADFIIFQSKECLDTFRGIGYKDNNYTIIHNGVDHDNFVLKDKFWDKMSKLKVFSCNWSSNVHKGYKTITDFSEIPSVESTFVGNWPNEVDKKNVKVYPPVRQEELVHFYRNADIFLHPAENDPCPNVVLEAMSCGLPVIYHNSGGTVEIASGYGVSLPETINRETINKTLTAIKNKYDYFVEQIIKNRRKFSMEIVVEEYLETFKKVLNNEM